MVEILVNNKNKRSGQNLRHYPPNLPGRTIKNHEKHSRE